MELSVLLEGDIIAQIDYVLAHNKLPLESLLRPLCLSVAQAQAQLTHSQDVEWLEAHCEGHVARGYSGGNNRHRRECPRCWQAFLEGKVE